MIRPFRSIVLCMLLVLLGSSNFLQAEDVTPAKTRAEFFPLKVGNYWLYQGVRRWVPAGKKGVVEQPLSWRMEVTEVISRDFITAAVLKGHPQDVARRSEAAQRGSYLVLAIGEDRYYFVQGVRVGEVLGRLKDKHDLLANLVFDDELFLSVPAAATAGDSSAGTTASPEGLPLRTASWTVAREETVVTGLADEGADPKFQKKFHLVFQALPNQTSVDFVPGVGITHYRYSHNGRVAEADLRLVEYFAG